MLKKHTLAAGVWLYAPRSDGSRKTAGQVSSACSQPALPQSFFSGLPGHPPGAAVTFNAREYSHHTLPPTRSTTIPSRSNYSLAR